MNIKKTLLALFLMGLPMQAEPAGDEGESVKDIISKMEAVYQNCETYADSGEVKTIFVSDDGERVNIKPFATLFVRPDRYRFEYSDKLPQPNAKPMRHVIWTNGKETHTWWDVKPGVKKPESLSWAIGAAAGVSGGSSINISSYLMPQELGKGKITGRGGLERIDDLAIGDVKCFRLQIDSGDPASAPVTVWVGKGSYLIHRIEEARSFNGFATRKVTNYKPEINIEIDDAKLKFNPPAHSAAE